MRTSEECLQQMEALLRRIVDHGGGYKHTLDEARAIVAEIDGPKTDEDWAEQIVGKDWRYWSNESKQFAVYCIAKGRELERAKIGLAVAENRARKPVGRTQWETDNLTFDGFLTFNKHPVLRLKRSELNRLPDARGLLSVGDLVLVGEG